MATVTLVTLALAAAGCGSSTLSSGQLRSSATDICNLARERTERIPTPPGPAGGETFLRLGVAALQPELTALKRLRPPEDLSGDWTRAVADSAGELQALGEAESSLRRGTDPVTAMRTLERHLGPLEAQGDAAWVALRIPACPAR